MSAKYSWIIGMGIGWMQRVRRESEWMAYGVGKRVWKYQIVPNQWVNHGDGTKHNNQKRKKNANEAMVAHDEWEWHTQIWMAGYTFAHSASKCSLWSNSVAGAWKCAQIAFWTGEGGTFNTGKCNLPFHPSIHSFMRLNVFVCLLLFWGVNHSGNLLASCAPAHITNLVLRKIWKKKWSGMLPPSSDFKCVEYHSFRRHCHHCHILMFWSDFAKMCMYTDAWCVVVACF